MTTAEPLTRYGAIGGRASRAAPLSSSYTTPRDTTHKHWAEGIWPHHKDAGVSAEPKWAPFIQSIKSGKRVILTEDKLEDGGHPTGRRGKYIALYRVDNVVVRDNELHFDFVERLAEFTR